MSDDETELEVPDLYDSALECHAHRKKPGVIGAPWHTHLCRQFPEHTPPHVCHSCGATWTRAGTEVTA